MREAALRSRSARPDAPASAEEILGKSLRVLAVLTAVSALTSVTFFHPDEHFQTVEFASLKLGFTAPSELPWEYAARLRPWLQPALYTLLAKGALALGVTSRFVLLGLFRAATALLSFVAFRAFALRAVRELPRERMRLAFARSVPLFGFLPYLFVRTSSETFAAAFFLFAVSAAWVPGVFSRRRSLVLGALLGLAFEARFQTAFAGLGVLAWLVVVRRVRVSALLMVIAGGLGIVALSLAVDAWGYGELCFPPWNYLRENVLRGVAKQFGEEPFWAYPLLVVVNVFMPVALVAVVAVGVAAWRFPRHVLTWVVVPFVVLHSLVSHKEERFLFPLAPLVPALIALAFSSPLRRRDADDDDEVDHGATPSLAPPVLEAVSYPRPVRLALAASVPVMLVHLVHPIGFRAQLHFAAAVDELAPFAGDPIFVATGVDVPDYPFLRTTKLVTMRHAAACVPGGARLVFSDEPAPTALLRCDGGPLVFRAVASELPLARSGTFASAATRVMHRWNALRDRGAPLPYLRFATIGLVTDANEAGAR